jgi:hypothetical protein
MYDQPIDFFDRNPSRNHNITEPQIKARSLAWMALRSTIPGWPWWIPHYRNLKHKFPNPRPPFASDWAFGDVFGKSVAISGDVVVGGAYGNDDNGESSGTAYIFESKISRRSDSAVIIPREDRLIRPRYSR